MLKQNFLNELTLELNKKIKGFILLDWQDELIVRIHKDNTFFVKQVDYVYMTGLDVKAITDYVIYEYTTHILKDHFKDLNISFNFELPPKRAKKIRGY